MSYRRAIEVMGYKVLEFKSFGCYQGTWAALLEDGGVIIGYYGSCSGCDAYEAAFAYTEPTDEILKKFFIGQGYTIHYDYDKLLIAEKWDSDSEERANWIKDNLSKYGFHKEADISGGEYI